MWGGSGRVQDTYALGVRVPISLSPLAELGAGWVWRGRGCGQGIGSSQEQLVDR